MPYMRIDGAASKVVAYTTGSLTVQAGHGVRFVHPELGNPSPEHPLLIQVGPDADGLRAVAYLTCTGRSGDILTPVTLRSGAVTPDPDNPPTVAAGLEKAMLDEIAGMVPVLIRAHGPPAESDGEDGDWWYDEDAYELFRKEEGDWESLGVMRGPPGEAATITIGTVTTGAPGSPASVVNSGTPSAAVLDFVIPEGEPGEDGGGGGGSGTVTEFTFLPANGFSGSVSNATTTPQLTVSTPVTGILKGSGGAMVAAGNGDVPGSMIADSGVTDVKLATSAVTTTKVAANAITYAKIQAAASAGLIGASAAGNYGHVAIGTGLSLAGGVLACTVAGTVTSVGLTVPSGLSVSGSPVTGAGAITVSTTLSGVLKGTGSGFIAATPGTDFQAPITLTTSGSSGPATLIGNTLNVPQYAGGVSYPLVDGASQSSGTADQWVFRDTLGVAASGVDADGYEGSYDLDLTLAVGFDLAAAAGITGGRPANHVGKITSIRLTALMNGASGGFTAAITRKRSGSTVTIATQAVAASNTAPVVIPAGSISDLTIQASDLFDVTITSPGSGVQSVFVAIVHSRRNR